MISIAAREFRSNEISIRRKRKKISFITCHSYQSVSPLTLPVPFEQEEEMMKFIFPIFSIKRKKQSIKGKEFQKYFVPRKSYSNSNHCVHSVSNDFS